jgi:hypothetical protein
MNRILLILSVIILFSSTASAQQADQENVLPPGPLIVTQLPDNVQYTIDFVYSDTPKAGEPSVLDRIKAAAAKDPTLAKELEDPAYLFNVENFRPVHVLVTQTGEITHIETTLEQGYQSESWSNHEIVVDRRPNSQGLAAGFRSNMLGNAFPDFDWISRGNFVNIQVHDQIRCAVFKQERYGAGHASLGPAVVYIDLTTHLPVSYEFGVETREYKFLPPPTVQQTIPDEFMAAGNAMKAQVRQATPHLAPP